MGNEQAKSDTRADRLADALRANLRRRKAQGRARSSDDEGTRPAQTPTTEQTE